MTLEWFVAFMGPPLALAGVALGIFFPPRRKSNLPRSAERGLEKQVTPSH